MSSNEKLIFEKGTCPKCGNEAVLKEDELGRTLICLYCGFYQIGSVSFFMHITDVNDIRKLHGLEPISKLIDTKKNN